MASWNENSSEDDEVHICAVNIEPNEVHPYIFEPAPTGRRQQGNHDGSEVDTDSIDSDNEDDIGDINPEQIGNPDW